MMLQFLVSLLLATSLLAQTKLQKADVTLAPPKNLKAQLPPGYTIPVVDISGETQRQTIVDREKGQYLGHPTTVLLEDHQTMLTVYPKGHGRGAIVYKRSNDAGLTWSERLPTPSSWETSSRCPRCTGSLMLRAKSALSCSAAFTPSAWQSPRMMARIGVS